MSKTKTTNKKTKKLNPDQELKKQILEMELSILDALF